AGFRGTLLGRALSVWGRGPPLLGRTLPLGGSLSPELVGVSIAAEAFGILLMIEIQILIAPWIPSPIGHLVRGWCLSFFLLFAFCWASLEKRRTSFFWCFWGVPSVFVWCVTG